MVSRNTIANMKGELGYVWEVRIPGVTASIMNKVPMMEPEDWLIEEGMQEEEGHLLGPESR